ncbi:LysR family transcriptional regulator, regulator for metE and metH [Allopseudospirillum japonicum]|uniref:HTH-type transcriptional regulator MetR n=1 Tax=Allopseudospirillum japonicum TaxID=64971 RepID=A0A1H6UK97_9GAMM|nr:LysR family transcriptional regulator [Allopseudospirillum japonicum]SEI88292.1 LysR family transcriptional regulator, regulator for metE and metH [Allopseudospirillum japonicum]
MKISASFNLDLRHLRTLQALRESGSLVDAAARLHLTQSALSHQIKELEQRLSCSLFVRKSKPLRFTPAGLRLLALSDQVLPQVQLALRDVQSLVAGDTGRLFLAIECHSCFQWLMPTLDAFREHWPAIEVDIPSGHHFDPLLALKRQALDLVITADPQPLDGLLYVPLFHYESLLAVSRKHPLAQKAWVMPQDLQEETLIAYPVEQERLDVFRHFLHPAKVQPLHVRTAEQTVIMMQLVASGRGVCALPNWALTEYLHRDYVAGLRLGEQGTWCTLYAAIHQDTLHLPFMQAFLETARTCSNQVLEGVAIADANQPIPAQQLPNTENRLLDPTRL